MTDIKQIEKQREFWIYQDDNELLDVCRYKIENSGEQEFHVIEYTALTEAQARIKKLEKALEVMRSAVEFYASADVWQHVAPEKAKWSVIEDDDLGDGDFDFNEITDDMSVGGKRARQALAEVEEILK